MTRLFDPMQKLNRGVLVCFALSSLPLLGCNFAPATPEESGPIPKSVNFAPHFRQTPVSTKPLRDRVEPTDEHRTFVKQDYVSDGPGETYNGPFASPTVFDEITDDLLIDIETIREKRGPHFRRNLEAPMPKASDVFQAQQFTIARNQTVQASHQDMTLTDANGKQLAKWRHPVVASVDDVVSSPSGDWIAIFYRHNSKLAFVAMDGGEAKILDGNKAVICFLKVSEPNQHRYIIADFVPGTAQITWLADHLLAAIGSDKTTIVDIEKQLVVATYNAKTQIATEESAPSLLGQEKQVIFPKSDEPSHQALMATDRTIALNENKIFRVEVNFFNTPKSKQHMSLVLQRLRRHGFPIGDGKNLVRVTTELELTDRLAWGKSKEDLYNNPAPNKIYIPTVKYKWQIKNAVGGTELEKFSNARFKYGYSRYFDGPHSERGRARTSMGATFKFPMTPEICILEEILEDKSQLVCPRAFVQKEGFAHLKFGNQKATLPLQL